MKQENLPIHVLVIDDDSHVRLYLRLLLEREGFEVTEAVDGIDGIRKHAQNPADLIITDIVMPEQEGIETIVKLKKDNPHVKIIAMSGGGRNQPAGYLSVAKTLGAEATFEKPIQKEELLGIVRSLLSE